MPPRTRANRGGSDTPNRNPPGSRTGTPGSGAGSRLSEISAAIRTSTPHKYSVSYGSPLAVIPNRHRVSGGGDLRQAIQATLNRINRDHGTASTSQNGRLNGRIEGGQENEAGPKPPPDPPLRPQPKPEPKPRPNPAEDTSPAPEQPLVNSSVQPIPENMSSRPPDPGAQIRPPKRQLDELDLGRVGLGDGPRSPKLQRLNHLLPRTHWDRTDRERAIRERRARERQEELAAIEAEVLATTTRPTRPVTSAPVHVPAPVSVPVSVPEIPKPTEEGRQPIDSTPVNSYVEENVVCASPGADPIIGGLVMPLTSAAPADPEPQPEPDVDPVVYPELPLESTFQRDPNRPRFYEGIRPRFFTQAETDAVRPTALDQTAEEQAAEEQAAEEQAAEEQAAQRLAAQRETERQQAAQRLAAQRETERQQAAQRLAAEQEAERQRAARQLAAQQEAERQQLQAEVAAAQETERQTQEAAAASGGGGGRRPSTESERERRRNQARREEEERRASEANRLLAANRWLISRFLQSWYPWNWKVSSGVSWPFSYAHFRDFTESVPYTALLSRAWFALQVLLGGFVLLHLVRYFFLFGPSVPSMPSVPTFSNNWPSIFQPSSANSYLTEDQYKSIRESIDHRLAALESHIGTLPSGLPKLVPVQKDSKGNVVIDDGHWAALLDRVKKEGSIFVEDRNRGLSDKHTAALRKRLEKDGLDTILDDWLSRNRRRIARILGVASSQSPSPSGGGVNTNVPREEYMDALKDRLAKEKAETDKRLKELRAELLNLVRDLRGAGSSLTKDEVKAIVRQVTGRRPATGSSTNSPAGSARPDAFLDHRVNLFSIGNGALVDLSLTSPTYTRKPSVGSRNWLRYLRTSPQFHTEPFQALTTWNDAGHCWCAAVKSNCDDPIPADIGVQLSSLVIPKYIVVEHINPLATKDAGAMPKNMEVWAHFDDPERRQTAQRWAAIAYPKSRDDEYVKKGFAQIASFTYEHTDANDGVLVKPFSGDLGEYTLPTDLVMIRAATNYGDADRTCFYRLKFYGQEVHANGTVKDRTWLD